MNQEQMFEDKYMSEIAFNVIKSKGWALYKMFDGLRGIGLDLDYIIFAGKSNRLSEFNSYLLLPNLIEPYCRDKSSIIESVKNANSPPCYVDFECLELSENGNPIPSATKVLGVYPIDSIFLTLRNLEYRLSDRPTTIEVSRDNALQSLKYNLNPYRVRKQ